MKPVIFDNFDVNTDLKNNITEIYDILATNGLVLFKNQHLTASEQETVLKENFYFNEQYATQFEQPHFKDFLVEDSSMLIRVTGQVNQNGKPGAFNDPNGLVWHTDNPTSVMDRNLTWRYGYQGTKGSVTSYCNTNMAFNDLDPELQETAKKLTATATSRFTDKYPNEHTFPLYSNFGLGYSWTFPFEQIDYFDGLSIEESNRLKTQLAEEGLKEKYCYDHHWEDNDLIISNEKITIHKRLPFNKMEERVMHKGTVGFKL